MNAIKPEVQSGVMTRIGNALRTPLARPFMVGGIGLAGAGLADVAGVYNPDRAEAAVTGSATTVLSCVTNPDLGPDALKMVEVRHTFDNLQGFNDGSLVQAVRRIPASGPEELVQEVDIRSVLSPFRLGDGETTPAWNLEDQYSGVSTIRFDAGEGPSTWRVQLTGFPAVEQTLDCNPVGGVTPPPIPTTPTTPDAPAPPTITEPITPPAPPVRLCGRMNITTSKVVRTGPGKWLLTFITKNTGNGTIESDGNAAHRNPAKARAAAGYRVIAASRIAFKNSPAVLSRSGAVNVDLTKDIAPGRSTVMRIPFTTATNVRRAPRLVTTGVVPPSVNGSNCLTATGATATSR